MESSGIPGSPKTPVKKVTSKTRVARKDLACLICGMSLVGERCTFNVENQPGLRAKLQSILEESIDVTVQSSRVCRPCGRQTESLEKRYNVVMQQIREFRAKYSSCCRKMVSVKRLTKSSPSPKAHKKIRSGRLSLFSSNCNEQEEELSNFFQPLPETVESCNSSQPMEVVDPIKPLEQLSAKEDAIKSTSDKVPVQVVLSYPSGQQKKNVKGEVANVVKYLSLGLFGTACKAMTHAPELSRSIKELLIKEMDNELEELCKKRKNSILRQTKAEGLVAFCMEKLVHEIEKEIPLLNQLLESLCCSKSSKRASGTSTVDQNVKATIAATILRERCPEMSALAYRTGLVLRHTGTGGLGLEMLCKMGLSCHPTTVSSKLKELGKDHDRQLLEWKERDEFHDEVQRCNDMLTKELREVAYLPKPPSMADFQACTERLKNDQPSATPTTCTSSSSSLMTLDATCLNLVCNADTNTVVQNICSKVLESGISKDGLVASVNSEQNSSIPTVNAGYQIVGDNCDLHVNVRHMTTDNKNKSFHWFNSVAFQDQVSGNHLPDKHEVTLEEVPVSSFFPSNEDTQELKRDFMVLWSRVIVKYMPSFAFLKKSIIYHIPHQYSEVMKLPVPEIPLGVLPKNENVNEDMVDILEHLQNTYVPMTTKVNKNGEAEKVPLSTVFFGGDQLTEERARNVQLARSDGADTLERLQGVWPKNEDWHAIRIAYKVVMDMLRKGNSLVDWGTFASNAIITGNSNALGDVLGENYDKIREFFQTETDAFICSATMTYFGMDDVSEEPKEHCLPEGLKEAGVTEKRLWFHQQLYSMLDAYIMDSVESLKDHGQEEEEVVGCRDPACNRTFKYRKCRTRHEQNTHSLFVEEETTDKAKTKKPEDGIFNYGCLHISLGLLIRDAEDAVKEGDGDRLIRVWKFLTFLYRLNGANKYALAGLRVQASISGLLTPRDAHRFKWNRFAGLQEGPGTRISRDLRLEQHNKIAKEEIRALGVQNINNKSVEEITKSEGSMEKIIIGTRCDLAIEKGKGHHSNKNKSRVFSNILEQVHHKSKIFKHTVGREYKAFPRLQRNIFCALDKKSTHQWINRHKRQWHRHNRYLYRQD